MLIQSILVLFRSRLLETTWEIPASHSLSVSTSNMSSVFEIKERTIECQHIRQYARATLSSQEDVLQLAIKQYIPLDNHNPQEGDITIIGACANGFPKAGHSFHPYWRLLNLIFTRNYMSLYGKTCIHVKKPWLQDKRHLDSRHSNARLKRYPERTTPWQRS